MGLQRNFEARIADFITPVCMPGSPGCAVGIVHGSEVVYAKGFGCATLEHPSPIGIKTVFDVGSLAKPFTGMAIALLEEENALAASDEIRRYLPDLPYYAQGVTIAHLLHHTSGIRNYTVLAYYMLGYHESDAITREEIYDLLKGLKTRNFPPGERYEYSDSNYFLLAQIVERVSGETLGAYTERSIFSPLAMRHTLYRECHSKVIPNRAVSYVPHAVCFQAPAEYRQAADPDKAYHALVSTYEHVGAEGLFTTLGDLTLWSESLADGCLGVTNAALLERVLTPGKVRINQRLGYGYGFNIGEHKGETFFGHDGAIHGYTSSLMRLPERDTTIICLTNQNKLPAWTIRDQIMDFIFPKPGGNSTPSCQPVTPVSGDEIGDICGFYQNPRTADIWKILVENDVALVRVNKSWDFELVFVAPNVFKSAEPGSHLQLRFIQNDAGKTIRIHGSRAEDAFVFEAFPTEKLSAIALHAYTGDYHCAELKTTFSVEVSGGGIWLKNKNRHFCSMDLVYKPTIRDHFIAYDPHPGSSQIEFSRERGRVAAFVYRDYDGDGREAFRFIRQ